ncbi:RNA 2',3'-cyclic phosphodiesterase [Amycolatopsis acidiphila]|uniref:RNA 2',3'-cyclic phosphodiesterase n=1 Tax=Amycolatopsis acidiphila TaxID=715473 RepID=A0A557ZY46_9PSEU|nr:RNA 2',3'-cyclic phosphodiesterase [Amycolatopsis acidiphila]TVT16930.1 RNA 2',3'-cyclic phosphodiesterase [Amycolatopsis acidiphila]UIJ62099.1 RNA 2',3'-cyclic phosphodiesterase [Amycolatopsis acidiphila]GHG91876.1 RNA 2',3'-cyclic phosphodiesterase [Amycolatopsis acidiphila]
MLLFSALLPPAQVAESLRVHLEPLQAEVTEPRWTPPAQWHITLGFYGDQDDEEARVDWLTAALAGHHAPMLRLEGAGTFSRVLYLGVYSEGLTELAAAAGAGEDRPYLPHLTVARTAGDVPAELPGRLSGFVSEPWTATEVVLMRSERTEHGARYSIVARFPLESHRSG